MKKWVVFGLVLLFGAGLAGAPTPAAAELKVGVSGYVKLDIQHSDKIPNATGLSSGLPSTGPADVPLDTDPVLDNSQTLMDARESRLRVTFSDDVAGVKLSGRIETDFFGSGVLRLRHAFARGDHPSGFYVLAGQTWSLFMNSDIAQPDLVDFNGPAGQLFSRVPQLRVGYKNPLARGMGDLLFEADIERHSTSDLGAAAVVVDESTGEGQVTPLFAGKVSWLHPRFQVEAAFAVADSTVIVDTTGADTSETAFGFQVSAQANFDPFTIFGHYQMIDGLGRLANGDFPDAFLPATTIENVESTGFYFGATYNLTKDTSVTAMYGWAEADSNPGFAATAQESQNSIHVNILHNFWQRWRAGLEFRRFDVEAFNGTSGDVNIIHGALWFFF